MTALPSRQPGGKGVRVSRGPCILWRGRGGARRGVTKHIVLPVVASLRTEHVLERAPRIALKEIGCPKRFWSIAIRDFVKKSNILWARQKSNGQTSAAYERMQPIR